jgi:membrane protease YdiL (CAAX protease family)
VNPADFTQGPIPEVLGVALFAGALWLALRPDRHQPPLLPLLPPWRTSWINFGLWAWIIVCVSSLAGIMTAPYAHEFPPDSLPQQVVAVIGFEIPLLIAQFGLLRLGRHCSPAPLDTDYMRTAPAIWAGFVDFLKGLPLIYLTVLIWQEILGLLKTFDQTLETPIQVPIQALVDGSNPWLVAAFALMAVTIVPLNEELLFRGALYRFVKGHLGRRGALVVVSFLFALVHGSVLQFLPLLLVGAFLIRTYERTGRIIAPVVFHGCFNALNIVLLLLWPHLADGA